MHFVTEREKIHSICFHRFHIAWFVTVRDGSKLRNPCKSAFFVREQGETRLAPEFRVSFVEEKEAITADQTLPAINAKDRENQATGCPVHDAEEKDSIKIMSV